MISHDYDDKHLDGKGLDYLIEQLDVRYGGGGSTPVLDDYYTKEEVDALIPTVPTNVSAFNNDAGYLTQHQSLAEYYTKSQVDNMIPTVPTNVSAFTNDAGYLTQHQSLDNYYTKSEVYNKTETYTKTEVNNLISSSGGGDMLKSVYDPNDDGIVSQADYATSAGNALSVNSHTVAKDVPANAVFTDTVYDDTALSGRVTNVEGEIGNLSNLTTTNKSDLVSAINEVAAGGGGGGGGEQLYYLGETSGNAVIDLPQTFSELMCVTSANEYHNVTFNIPASALRNDGSSGAGTGVPGGYHYKTGGYMSYTSGGQNIYSDTVDYLISTTKAKTFNFWQCEGTTVSSDIVGSTSTKWYVRSSVAPPTPSV